MHLSRYIEWGWLSEVHGEPDAETEHIVDFDPTNIESFRDIWAALPPDLRLALAKTAPKVAGPWSEHPTTGQFWRSCPTCDALCFAERPTPNLNARGNVMGQDFGPFLRLSEAQSACDAELIRQGYVLDNG